VRSLRQELSHCLSNTVHNIRQNINSSKLRVFVRCPSSVCGQDCELNFGPIFTKLGTQLSLNIPQKTFLGSHQNGQGQGHVAKFLILHPSITSATNYLLNDLGYTDCTIGYFVARHRTDFVFIRTLSCLLSSYSNSTSFSLYLA